MSIIINDLVENYIDGLYKCKNEFLKDMRAFAEQNNIPIITKDTEQFMSILLTIHRPRRLLEIGTAIGYSAMSFAATSDELEIVSIELGDKMYDLALKNIADAGLNPRIKVIKGDAREVLSNINPEFDMIFIDAAKGQYKLFFDDSQKLLSPKGIIVSDNVLYKGMTASNEYLVKRKRTIVKRMREYLKYISNHPEYETAVLPIGDGIAVSVRKG
ncbi:MAG: O-methyltransferase [Clostridiales bacterium]|nr:O-methyltransferase [Clostridiales bacterium]